MYLCVLVSSSVSVSPPDITSITVPEVSSPGEHTPGSTSGVSTTDKGESSSSPRYSSPGLSTDETTTTTTTERSFTEPPYQTPISDIFPKINNFYPTRQQPEKAGTGGNDIVALVIGIVAAILIVVVLLILLFLKLNNSRLDGSFKVDDGKAYQQGPNAALLGNTSNTNGQTQYQLNGALRNGDKGQMHQKKKRDSKDIKEWYV